MAREFAKAFYKSEAWQNKRNYILIRDQYRCKRCGKSGALEVHHIIHLTPENIHDAAITLSDENLTTLCLDCHFAVHEEDKKRGQKIRASKEKKSDCSDGFMFDANGFLVPVENSEEKH